MDRVGVAYNLALSNLKSLYGKEGIFAGSRHFNDYWARDSFFASFGCLAADDYYIVKKNLGLHLGYMNKNGQLALRIGATTFGVAIAALGIKLKKRFPLYTTDKNKYPPTDQNSLFIIVLLEYVKKTKDYPFLKENLKKAEEIMSWNFTNDIDNDFLMEEHEYCSWADSIKKKGKVLYTNVCHCHALKCMSELYRILKNKQRQAYYLDLHKKTKDKINELFWAGEHYMDWIDKDRHYNYFSTDGNLLAILWDIAERARAKHIEEASHIFDINDIPSACVHPLYPKSYVSSQIRMIGLGDYHSGLSWLWLGCINALAKDKLGMKKEALDLLGKIADIIIEGDGVYEIYEKTGKPVNRLIYKAEFPFAWSSGLFIYTVKKLKSENF